MYSVWTNSSFKAPLIASGIACLAGNFLYCLGYDFQSFWILLLARLITGFGELRPQLRPAFSIDELRSGLRPVARPNVAGPVPRGVFDALATLSELGRLPRCAGA